MTKTQAVHIFISFWLLSACVEPYNPPEIENAESLLVIDAQIDGESGSGVVLLKGTVPLDASMDTVFDIRAAVSVEDENGVEYFFNYEGEGKYTIDGLNLNYGEKLRLNVLTQDENEYQSDFVEFKETPEIDSVSWEQKGEGLQFYVSTNDPENNSTFYKWEFEETWEFNSAYPSSHIYNAEDSSVSLRQNPRELYICYKYHNSSHIILGSSERYSQDLISEEPVVHVKGSSGKFDRRYSLLVRQKALSQEEYEYWLLLKKNTEDLGGFFDPQPSQIPGNIHNLNDPGQNVLGYFFINSYKEKRIFVDDSEVPDYDFESSYASCRFEVDTLAAEELPGGDKLIISEFMIQTAYFYLVSWSSCIDCRYRGSNVKPSYWEE